MADNERTQTLSVLGSPDTSPQINTVIQQWMTIYRQSSVELQKQVDPETFTDGKIVYLPLSNKKITSLFYEENHDDQNYPPHHIKGADDSGQHTLIFESTATAKFAPGIKKPSAEYTAYDAITGNITAVTESAFVTNNSTFDAGLGTIPTIGIIGPVFTKENNINTTNGVLLWVNPSFKATGFIQK